MIVHLQKITIRSIFASLIFVAGIQFVGTVHADSFVVTSMSDDGAGSLRVAMVNAQASSNTDDLITFSSSVTGTITLNSALPVIAAASSGGALTITGPGDTLLTINGNQGNFSIFSVASGGNLSVSGLTVSGAKHTDGSGGAFYNLFGTLSISNSTLSNNFSGGGGGAIWSRGPLSVSNSSFANNSAQSSGAISIMGVTTISNSSFTNNFTASGGSGGAILVFPSINGNLPEFSTLRLSNSTFSGNTIDGGQGSAISNAGETIISNTTIFGNTGGEAIANEGTLTVSNCTISGNIQRAINSGFGTGIFNSINGTLVLENTIIANSVDGTDFEGKAPTTNTNNLVETIGLVGGVYGGGSFTPSITADPKLGPLQNNGGFTKTMALLPGSPAIGTGGASVSNASPINGLDQRGFVRNASDIGAYSYNFALTGNIVVSKSSDNQLVLSLASDGVTLSDLHTQYSGNALTITTTGARAITTVPNTGIAGVSTTSTASVTVDMSAFQAFSGLTVVGNSNSDDITLSSPGIDLTTVSGGSANQSVTVQSIGNSQFALNAAAEPKGNGGLTLGAGTLSVNLTDITTAGGDQNYTGGMIINSYPGLILTAGSGAINITGNIDSKSSNNYSLTINNPLNITNSGDVTIGGTIGGTQALGALLITGNDIRLGNIGGASAGTTSNVLVQTVDLNSDIASITLSGTIYNTTGQQFYNSSALTSINVDTTITSNYDGTRSITLSGGSAGSTINLTTAGVGSNNAAEFTGLLSLNGRNLSIDTTNNNVTTGGYITFNQTVNGAGALALNAGSTGNIIASGTIGATTTLTGLTITNAASGSFTGSIHADNLTITDATDADIPFDILTNKGIVNFQGDLTVNTGMTIAANGAYNVQMIGASNTIAGVTTFGNSGSIIFGDAGTDTFNFTGGIIATAPSAINLIGTVNAAGAGIITLGDSDTPLNVKNGNGAVGGASTGTITLGNAILEDGVTLTVGTGIANTINMAAVTGTASAASSNLILNTTGAVTVAGAVGTDIGTLTITNSGGTTFQSTVAAATTTITNTTGTVKFEGNMNLTTSLVTAVQGYNVSITGTSNNISGATTFLNTGTVTLGNGTNDSTTFAGGLVITNPSSIAIQGTVATTNTTMTLGDAGTGVILGANTSLNAGAGNINLNGIVSGLFSLTPITSSPGFTTISGANSNTTTHVTTGVVQINNSTPQTTNFIVSGGTLKGTGAIGTLTATGTGVIAPGNSPGKVTTTNLSLSSTNTLQIEITGAGTDYDQIVVSSGGSVNLGGATLNLSSSLTGNAGSVFTIIDNQGSSIISTTFNSLAEGAVITANGRAYQISYVGGTGNDVTLTAVLPVITAINPTFGPTSGGSPITITGSNFTGATAVNFGASAAASFTINSVTSITATSPAGSGTVDITVTTLDGTSSIGVADQYTYVPPPTITGISPSSGPITGGTVITITGTNLTGATDVTLNGSGCTAFNVSSSTSLTCTTPVGTYGSANVLVTTPGGMNLGVAQFNYTAGAASMIAVNAGDNQSAMVGAAVTTAPSVLVSDASGNPVSGTSVTFAVASGGGGLASSGTVTTNSSGIATAPVWTLGTTAGSNTLIATSGSLSGSPVTFTATGISNAAITPTSQTISGTVGTAITSTETLSASGYSGTVSYAISPSLPSGLSLNSTSGVITGTPTVSQVATSYIITGTGATSGTATTTVILTVVNAVPAAPTAISASPGDAQASISWTAPSNGGATITSYTAAGTPGGQTCISSGNPADARCIVSGLTNGTTYSFTVTATNNIGTGPASLASNLVTPASHALTPAAPATPSVAASDSQVSVSWEQVLTGGDPSSYLVTATPGGQTCTSSFPGRAFSSASCSVTGLTNGTAYTFKVLASNSIGSASSESSASVTPQAIMNGSCGTANGVASVVNPSGNLCESGTPTVVESGQGSFTWSCAGANGGNTAYCLAPGQLDTSQNATTTFTTPTANGCQIQRVQLLPVFNGGPGGGVTMPYEVLDFEMVGCQATQATVTMTYSQVVEGIDFWKYIRGNWIQLTQANSELALVGNTATFTILDNGPLDADPAVGQISDPAGPGYSSLPALPGTPVNPEATAGDSEAAVSWTAPSGGATPVTYTVTSTPDSQTCTALAPITTCNVNGLTNNTYYTFGVVANNSAGSSPVSSDSNSVTPSYSGQAGNCGTATTQASLTPPQTDLCSVGTASTVVAANGGYTWQCDAVGHNIAASCSAQGATSTGAIGSTTFNLLPGSGCSIKTAQIGNQAAATPTGVTLSNGVVSFTLTGCTQSADLSSTFSSAVNGLAQWEWIHQVWVTIPGAVLSGNAATFTIADNGPYDTDSTVGTISVASGPGNTNGKSSQQTLSLASNVNSIKSGRAVLLKVTGGSSNGRVSYSTQSSGGVSCSVRAVGNQSILKTSGKKNGTCSAWATKAAKATYNAAVSSPVTVNVTGAR